MTDSELHDEAYGKIAPPMTGRSERIRRCLVPLLLAVGACAKPPEGRSAIDEVRIAGATEIDVDDLLSKIATAPSEKFLGLFRGVVYDYEVYDVTVLQRDLARIERYCRGHGFFSARTRAARVERLSDGHVRIEIVVDEGPPTVNGRVDVVGVSDLPAEVTTAIKRAAQRSLRPSRRFDEERYAATSVAIRRELTNAGYAYADVVANARWNPAIRSIDYTFTVRPGPRATFGAITFEGLDPDGPGPRQQELDEGRLRHALGLVPDAPYSTSALDTATQALLDLGVFSAAEIVPDLSAGPRATPPSSPSSDSSFAAPAAASPDSAAAPASSAGASPAPAAAPADSAAAPASSAGAPPAPQTTTPAPETSTPSTKVPLTVRVEPTRLRQIRLGAGVDFDQVKTELHALAGWEDHNFLGGLRDLSIELRPGVVLWPTRVNNIVAPDLLLPEERLRIQLRQPGFLEARTNGFVRPELNVYPLLVTSNPSPDSSIVGYREIKLATGLDRRFSQLFTSIAYNLQVEWPFSYKGPLDRSLDTVFLLFPQLITTLDFRNDAVHPHSGVYISNDLQMAGVPFHGSAKDLRIQPEVRGYVPLGRRLTWATRGSLGFLFPSDYGETVENSLNDVSTDDLRARRVRDIETVYLRGFFSGGANSNRGYPFRGIGPRGVVPFLNPSTAAQQLALQCDPTHGPVDPTVCSLPTGGFTLWELSTELRVAVAGAFATAVFCDASDVSPRTADLRSKYWHLSCGLGVRYDTPVGPIRLDAGYRIPGLQVLGVGGDAEDQPKFLGQPIAIAFGIGEAY